MSGGCVWILVIAAAVCAVAVNEDKAGVKSEQEQRRQQSADMLQTLEANGAGGRPLHSIQTPAVGYFAEPLGYLQTKRAHNKQYGFGLGKRLYRQYEFGLGKRSTSKQYGFGLGKRAALEQDGWPKWPGAQGKRASPTFYNFGLGRRASPQYSFGLGKRVSHPSYLNVDDREADYTYNDLSEEKKRTSSDDMGHGQRFAFGLGKRGADAAAEWDDGDVSGLTASIWHPAVRRARLQYGFGLGKRADDYDDGSEYAAEPQFRDDTVADIN